MHLGMSGRILVSGDPLGRFVQNHAAIGKHDHVIFHMEKGTRVTFNDPRRFGACLWQGVDAPPLQLLQTLGPEPLTDAFDGERLFERSRGKSVAVKNFIMHNAIVVGVGNIYASEALYWAGIDPPGLTRTPTRTTMSGTRSALSSCSATA